MNEGKWQCLECGTQKIISEYSDCIISSCDKVAMPYYDYCIDHQSHITPDMIVEVNKPKWVHPMPIK